MTNLIKPPEWLRRTRRKLQNTARTLTLAAIIFFVLGLVCFSVGLGIGLPELGFVLLLVPGCLALAFVAAILTTMSAVFAKYSLGGMMKVVLSGASCMAAIASGHPVFIVLGVLAMSVWTLVMIVLISNKENQYDWEEENVEDRLNNEPIRLPGPQYPSDK